MYYICTYIIILVHKEIEKYTNVPKGKANVGHEQTNHWNIFEGALMSGENLAMYRTFSHRKHM